MHVYLLNTKRRIAALDRAVGQVRIHNLSLNDTQHRILADLHCTIERIDSLHQVARLPCLVIYDDLYFTHYALAGFLKAVRQRQPEGVGPGEARGSGNWRAALRMSPLTETFATTFQGTEIEGEGGERLRAYDCYYLRRFDPQIPLADQSEVLAIPHRQTKISTRVSRYFDSSKSWVVPVSLVFMTPIQHWANLVAVNMLGMPALLARTVAQRPVAAAALVGKVPWRAGSIRPASLLGKLYLADRGCRVHPTAYVEGCLLGRRVKIGPHAVVRHSIIGDWTEIGPGATVDACTLGNAVKVDGRTVTRCCLIEDGASLGSLFMQLSLFGRGATICPGSGLMGTGGIADFTLRGTVAVVHEGQTVPSGSRFLGACLGEDAFLGPGVPILCGREIPNGCILVANPREAVRDVNDLPPRLIRLDAGRRKSSRSPRNDPPTRAA